MPRAAPLPPEKRRAALIAATEPLLAIHGRNLSTRQIAEAAGIAEGTIFRVFPNKESLIDAVVEDAFDPRRTCEELAAIDLQVDLETRLESAVTVLQGRLRRVFALFHSLAISPREKPDEDFRARQVLANQLLNAALAGLLTPDADRLRFDPEDAASVVRSLTFSLTHPILSDQRHADPRRIVQIALYGIATPPPGEGTAC